eukprot:CAMPEP_0184534696 /NCGR_PEP_ID=MMETSP0198_2-20121128/15479_1 /TAXON_ID=1112570 /ORGANISM="Thraustochytrium sp., Strain LLF1b" /LENGTH=344 /DNA_ID=CAMNT_0026927659 /DNA_START=475 /DNA_END=1510 /DNA_ORIENTATION=-
MERLAHILKFASSPRKSPHPYWSEDEPFRKRCTAQEDPHDTRDLPLKFYAEPSLRAELIVSHSSCAYKVPHCNSTPTQHSQDDGTSTRFMKQPLELDNISRQHRFSAGENVVVITGDAVDWKPWHPFSSEEVIPQPWSLEQGTFLARESEDEVAVELVMLNGEKKVQRTAARNVVPAKGPEAELMARAREFVADVGRTACDLRIVVKSICSWGSARPDQLRVVNQALETLQGWMHFPLFPPSQAAVSNRVETVYYGFCDIAFEAIQNMEAALFVAKGECYLRDGAYVSALEDVNAALEKRPNLLSGLCAKAKILERLGRKQEAAQVLHVARANDNALFLSNQAA